jgi:hypothetical protein
MIFEGTQLARAMLSIHAVEMEQATRCAGWRSVARIERHIALHQAGNRALCRLGSLPLGSKATQRG